MIHAIRKKLSGDASSAETIKGSASNFLIRIVGLIAGYLFTLFISRFFGAGVLGAHTISTTVLMMFTIPGRLGMDLHIVKAFSTGRLNGRWDLIHEIYRKTVLIGTVLGIILSGLLYFSSEFIAVQLFNKPFLVPYLKVIAFAVLPMTMRFINSECYRGFGMNRQYVYSQNVSYFLYALVILGALTLFSQNPLLPNIAFLISLFILASSSTYLVFKRIWRETKLYSNEWPVKNWIRSSAPMMMAGSLLLISGWINTIVLGAYESAEVVGVFAVIIKVTAFANFVLQAVNGIATPKFAQLHGAGDHEGLKSYVTSTTKIIFWASLPLLLLLTAGGWFLLGLFGKEFTEGYAALLVVMGGKTIGVLCGSNGNLLNMTGHQVPFRNIMATSTIISIVVCVILIPSYGMMGSAISTAIFIAIWNLASVIYIKRKLGIKTYYMPF